MDAFPSTLASYAVVGIILLSVCAHIMRLCITTRPRKLPPGPPGWPIVGHLFLLGKNPHESLFHLAQKYGPLMTLRLGTHTTVVVSSPAMAKEVLNTNDHISAFRSIRQATRSLSWHQYSLIWAQYGPRWRMLRRICNTELFSAKRLSALQHLRREQVFRMLAVIYDEHLKGQSVNIGQAAFLSALNLMGNMIFTQNMFHPNSSAFQAFRQAICEVVENVAAPNLADFFPFLRFVDPQRINRRTAECLQRVFNLFDNLIEDRIALSESKDDDATQAKDFLDVLMDLPRSDGETAKFSRMDIKTLLLEMFGAAAHSTSTTIEWAMAELIRNPHEMKRAQAELDEVVGRHRRVEESDIQHLPYLRAVVKEVFRLHAPSPLLAPHKANNSCEVGGFYIPKDAEVIVNVWGMGRDPSVWNKPLEFAPERFVQSEVDYKGTDFELIPFGAGKRICPGLPLANRMVGLVLASLVHSFDWCLPDGQSIEHMDMTGKFGSTLPKAVPLKAIPKPRLSVTLECA